MSSPQPPALSPPDEAPVSVPLSATEAQQVWEGTTGIALIGMSGVSLHTGNLHIGRHKIPLQEVIAGAVIR